MGGPAGKSVEVSHFKQNWLAVHRVPELRNEILCDKHEVHLLKRLFNRTVSGPELARISGVNRNLVYKWMKAGKLKPTITPDNTGFGYYRYPLHTSLKLLSRRER